MKQILIATLSLLTLITYSQSKHNYVHFDKLTEVAGTEYVIAYVENFGKINKPKGKYFLFINTKTGEANQVDFPSDANIGNPEQIKIDSLGINLIVVAARAIDLNRKIGIDWNDPTQIIVLSTDGKQKEQLTDNKFFTKAWVVNRQTGTIVITGHYDTNNNNKYDKTDNYEIHIYDLKTLKLINKIDTVQKIV